MNKYISKSLNLCINAWTFFICERMFNVSIPVTKLTVLMIYILKPEVLFTFLWLILSSKKSLTFVYVIEDL